MIIINKKNYHLTFLISIFFLLLGNKAYSNNLYSVLEKECEKGNGQICFELGHKYISGKGVKKNINIALKLYQKAFDLNHLVAYVELGRIYQNGEIIKKDLKKAKNYYQKACDAGEKYSACLMVEYVDKKYTKEEDYKTIESMKKQCNKKGSMLGLTTCGTLGNIYKKYDDFENAIKYYKKACNVFSSECISVGEVYLNKKYNGYNKNKAITYFKKACNKGKGEGCIKAGEVYKNLKNNDKQSKVYFKKACSLKFLDYCEK